jgi:hypothetical protein
MTRTEKIQRFFRDHWLLLIVVTIQVSFWTNTKDIKPKLDIVPPVPGKAEIHALTFGDDEFYFRMQALLLQNTGDTYGRFSPLKYYDMKRLSQWFSLMDLLDSRSNMMPAMAAYYFSQTQNSEDVKYIVDYLYDHSTKDIGAKWWWLLQGVYLAQHRLNDMDLALKLAAPLVDKRVPIWAQQMTAVVHEKRGEMEDALKIMEDIKNNADNIPDADLRYMVYFVKERLNRLDKLKEFEALKPSDAKIEPKTKPEVKK